MDNSAFVRVVQRAAGLQSVSKFQWNRQGCPSADEQIQALTFQQLHRDIGNAICIAQIVNRDNIWMLQTAGRLSLLIKALKQIGVFGQTRSDRLQCDETIDDGIASTVNHTSGSPPKFSLNQIFA